jgi:hypothetical protein
MDVTEFDIQTQITPCLQFIVKALKRVMMPFVSNDGLEVVIDLLLFRVSPEALQKF